MFQCLTGKTPFRDSRSVSRTYDNILYRRVRWPHGTESRVSPQAKDLLSRLFEPAVTDRIGGQGPDAAYATLMAHPWFAMHGIKWDNLYGDDGPYVPKLRGPMDVGYFECQTDLTPFRLSRPLPVGRPIVSAGAEEEGGGQRSKSKEAWPAKQGATMGRGVGIDMNDEDESGFDGDGFNSSMPGNHASVGTTSKSRGMSTPVGMAGPDGLTEDSG